MPRKKTESPAAETTEEKTGTAAKKPAAKKTTARKTKAKTGAATKRGTTGKKPEAKKETEIIEVVEAELVAENGNKKGGVGGNGNLIPLSQRTKEEQREIASAGGKASGESRRQRRAMRDYLNDFLDQDANVYWKANMEKLGFNADEMSNEAAMILSLLSHAVNKHDINAFRTVMEYAGRSPLQEMRENEAIAKMAQALQLAQGSQDEGDDDAEDVVFYIPNNGRAIILDEEPVNT